MKTTKTDTISKIEELRATLYKEWQNEVQGIANKHQVEIATGHLSNMWQVSENAGKTWLHQIHDEHPALTELDALDEKYGKHGIGPSNMERFKPQSEYGQQAEQFLTSNGIKFRATLSDTKTPAWSDNGKHGHHYRVTLSRQGWKPDRRKAWEKLNDSASYTTRRATSESTAANRLTFDFWGSIADAEKGIQTVRPYDVLACISGDAYTPDTFADFCAEYGYDKDSIKALQTFRRCSAFAKRLRAFFTESELEQLQEIN